MAKINISDHAKYVKNNKIDSFELPLEQNYLKSCPSLLSALRLSHKRLCYCFNPLLLSNVYWHCS